MASVNELIDVSIIIPCYNREGLVGEAIESALRRSALATEVIVVDDGSTDRSWSVIEGFGDRVRGFRTANAGVSAARNLGIDHANGRFIRFLDSDDRIPEGAIAAHFTATAALPVDHIAVGDAVSINADGMAIESLGYGYAALAPPGAIPRAVLIRYGMFASLPLFPRDACRRCGGFDTKVSLVEDTEFAMRVSRAGYTFVRVPITVCEIREHPGDRISRNWGPAEYRLRREMCELIWAGFNTSTSDRLSKLEMQNLGKAIWTVGRDASREHFSDEADALFKLALHVAGRGAWNARMPAKLLYLFLSPYRAERLLGHLKQVIGGFGSPRRTSERHGIDQQSI